MNRNKITSIVLATTILLETVPVVNAYDNVTLNDNIISIGNTENEEENDLDKDSTNPIDTTDAPQNNDINNSSNTNSDNLEESDFDINDFIDNSNINNNELGDTIDSDYIQEEVEDGIIQDEVYDDMFIDKEEVDISITNDNNNTIENSGQVKSNVLEISLADGEYVPDLTGNPDGYDTIKVTTIGNKKLVSTDYNRLRESLIPNIDLSNANSDSIPTGAFANATHLTSFQFPQGIKSIDNASSFSNGAFYNCTGLTGELIIPDSVTSIGDYAFYKCSGFTGNLIIPDSVTSIGDFAFYNCKSLTGDLVIPDSVTYIGREAFRRCSGFTGNLVIPDSVTSISAYAFNGCSGLTGNLVIPDSVTYIGDYAFYGCSGFNGNLIIPDSVTSIGQYAFYKCSGFTDDLIISDSVTSIGQYAFYNCSGFTGNLIIPDSVTSIGNYAFYNCSGFTGDLIIPNSVTTIGNYAFQNCSGFTGNLIIPDSVTYIGREAFMSCSNIKKFIFKTNESFTDSNYRKSIFDNLDKNKTIIEMSYNFDTTGTWLDTLDVKNNGKPVLKSETPMTDGKSSLMSLYIPTPYKEDNIIVSKDGEVYTLPTKTSDGKYLFDKEGSYIITLTTDLGSTSTIDFEVVSSINKPDINYENNMVSIIDNGNSLGVTTDRIEYRLNGGEWKEYLGAFRIPDELVNGIDDIKVEARVIVKDKISKVTECSLTIPKAQITVDDVEIIQGDSFDELDYATATDIDGTDISDDIEVVRTDVKIDTPGEYKVLYEVEGSNGYVTEKEITVRVNPIIINKPSIKYENNLVSIIDNGNNSNNKVVTIEYRINNGEWKTYSGEFRIPDEFVNGIDSIKVEARAIVGQYTSDISESNLTISKAEIIANDIEVTQGDNFDEYDIVTAIDIDGTDISGRVTVVSSDIKLDTPGEYKVVYRVEASNGYFTEKEIKVTVLKKKLPPIIIADDVVLNKGQKYDPLDFITVTDADGNLIDKTNIEIIENTVNVSVPGIYTITYRIIDDNGLTSTETITVTIKESIVSNGSGGNENNDSNKNNVNTENNNNINDKNNDVSKIPNAGGFTSLIYLSSLITIAGSYSLLRKRKDK